MTRIACRVIVLCLFLTARGIGQFPHEPRNPEKDRRDVEHLEQEWLNAESDRATLERILADDFVHPVSAGVFLDKASHIDWAVRHPRAADRRAKFETLRVRLFGDAAIATGIVADSAISGGDVKRTIFTDVFVFRQEAWRAVSAQETPIAQVH